jgi:hypothetical protein
LEEKTGRKWLKRALDFVNPLRDPSLTVAAVLTFIEEVGQHDAWYSIILVALVNWLAVRGVVWLVVNFAFAATFLGRRIYWAVKHPRLAWRLLDAVGHEEIMIGGMPSFSEGILLQDGTTIMSPMLGASGIHVLGELPAGTELPMLGMVGQQMDPASFGGNGFFPGSGAFGGNVFGNEQPQMAFPQAGNNDFVSAQSTDSLPKNFPQRPSQEEERLRQQVEAYSRLLEDWIQFTEEKWRTISDSQLGWKPLRGRWGNWDDIFSDVYAAKTSDPMAQAAQSAGEATARRFDTSREKGSAASAVSCFMRDMMTLRRGLDLLQQSGQLSQTSNAQPAVKAPPNRFGNATGTLFNGGSNISNSGQLQRSSLIRRPSPIFVDADTEK